MTIQCIARLRSRRVVQDQPEGSDTAKVEADGHGGCCWANLPHEMLREVLLRIEESGTRWPQRRNVVACAGVCKSWRFAIKEIVQVPQISGKLTFPISVKQPGPKDTLQCFIKRNRSTQTYYLYLGLTNALTDDGKFLLAACKWRRPICTDYIISLRSEDISKGSSTYVGKLSVLDGQPLHAVAKMTKSRSSRLADLKQVSPRVPSRNHPTVHISYELNMLGSRCVLYDLQGSKENVVYFGYHPGNFDKTRENFVSEPFSGQKDGGALVLRNKSLRTFNWWLLQKMDRLGQNMTRLSSSLEKLGRTYSPWTTGIRFLHSKHLLSASAVSTPRLLANKQHMVKNHKQGQEYIRRLMQGRIKGRAADASLRG
ncbi:hypothetical protein V6N12_073504 [Hibiscus sabdariffa]|uniref:Tubby C-terminal domain-containing protein n=1 Tax=Hibiscus sabdariffa TaxID=183260 RepID=A0ABR2AWJ1_9ROSI